MGHIYYLLPLILAFLPSCSNTQGDPSGTYTTTDGIKFRVETVAEDLEIPWSIAFAEGDMYFTERPGRLKVLKRGGVEPTLISHLEEVRHIGEGGLMGLAFHPRFEGTRFVYLSYTYADNGETYNKVVRYVLRDYKLVQDKAILEKLPGANVHNGCRIRFGPDGRLYVSTGDAAKREIAQDTASLGGKILRLNDDGSVPLDNPFAGSMVFSMGHRNGQGFDWHPQSGLLFEAEHGPSGFDGPGGGDEVNIVEPGKNYGWPIIHHQQSSPGLENPLLEFTPAIAPAGGSFYSGSAIAGFANNFFVATLRGKHVLRVQLREDNPREVVSTERMLDGVFGRIRDVVEGPDGSLYFCTSNRDGRGRAADNDDRILRIKMPN